MEIEAKTDQDRSDLKCYCIEKLIAFEVWDDKINLSLIYLHHDQAQHIYHWRNAERLHVSDIQLLSRLLLWTIFSNCFRKTLYSCKIELIASKQTKNNKTFLGYIIEKKGEADDRPTTFMADNHTPHVGLRYTVRGLPTDTRWSFRVRAVNKLGVGEPCEPTETLLIQSDEGNLFSLLFWLFWLDFARVG